MNFLRETWDTMMESDEDVVGHIEPFGHCDGFAVIWPERQIGPECVHAEIQYLDADPPFVGFNISNLARVEKFDSHIVPLQELERPDGWNRPGGIAVRDGRIVVTDLGDDTVTCFNAGGDLEWQIGCSGEDLGQFNMPSGVCIREDWCVIVCDSLNGQIQVLDKEGVFKLSFTLHEDADGLAVSPEYVACDTIDKTIVVCGLKFKTKLLVSKFRWVVQLYTQDGMWVRNVGNYGEVSGELLEVF